MFQSQGSKSTVENVSYIIMLNIISCATNFSKVVSKYYSKFVFMPVLICIHSCTHDINFHIFVFPAEPEGFQIHCWWCKWHLFIRNQSVPLILAKSFQNINKYSKFVLLTKWDICISEFKQCRKEKKKTLHWDSK